jgi:hypothetical protein
VPSIFASVPGRVVRVPVSYPGVRATMRFSEEFGYRTHGCIITEAAIDQNGNFQVLNTVSDLLYIDSFGDDPAEITVNGYAFLETCAGDEIATSGIDGALNYYEQNRLGKRQQPVVLLFGSKKFQGFLVASRVRMSNPEAGLGDFSMKFLTLPQ